ncbi:NUDIX hydrolase [Vibrio spartinae]|uniref:NADH pyrophosphatase n=1 Tax=Vibrio spartinae TaxID=1918945 RepID=A0ABX6R534_9VIBR|nr:NUDIX domain-containing protein [Vibrio spartinae]QMV16508.1 NADH pyrophosphatase [Vibrio spartinae]
MRHIRAKVVCLFRHQHRILLTEGNDLIKDEKYVIPVGGGIEFGEKSTDAVRRETFEEIGAEIDNLRLLGICENMFTSSSAAGHEIVFVYEAEFKDKSFYQRENIPGIEADGEGVIVRWFDEDDILNGSLPFYPDGIIDML